MHIVLYDNPRRQRFYPLTLTRAVADLRLGIFTLKERWQHITKQQVFILTDPVLQPLYPLIPSGDCLYIDAAVLPAEQLCTQVLNLNPDSYLVDHDEIVAIRTETGFSPADQISQAASSAKSFNVSSQKWLQYPFQLFQWNDEFTRFDFSLITKDRVSQALSSFIQTANARDIFVEAGASIAPGCILNASTGPIYIGKDVTIMEGCMLRGPIALGEGTTVKMGAKIYGATTTGAGCVLGGEIKNVVFLSNSNKAHDGYLGDSVIGEWCNLGAGTSNSNVKNTAGEVKQWNYFESSFISAGNKCGVIMGDYSKTAINSSINTGTVVGVCSNLFGAGLTAKVIPDFSWGMDGRTRYQYDKALTDIGNWKKMKNKIVTEPEAKMLKHIFDGSEAYTSKGKK